MSVFTFKGGASASFVGGSKSAEAICKACELGLGESQSITSGSFVQALAARSEQQGAGFGR